MTTPHRDASLLRAIADGKQMQTEGLTAPWADASGDEALTALAEGQPCRIKPDFVIVNGVECPKPLDEFSTESWVVTLRMRHMRGPMPPMAKTFMFNNEHDAAQVIEALIKPFKECQE